MNKLIIIYNFCCFEICAVFFIQFISVVLVRFLLGFCIGQHSDLYMNMDSAHIFLPWVPCSFLLLHTLLNFPNACEFSSSPLYVSFTITVYGYETTEVTGLSYMLNSFSLDAESLIVIGVTLVFLITLVEFPKRQSVGQNFSCSFVCLCCNFFYFCSTCICVVSKQRLFTSLPFSLILYSMFLSLSVITGYNIRLNRYGNKMHS